MVLTNAHLEHFVKPIGVGSIAELVASIALLAVTTGKWSARVGSSLAKVVAVLVSIHHVIDALADLINTKVTLVIDLQRLVLLTALGGDDDHAVGCT